MPRQSTPVGDIACPFEDEDIGGAVLNNMSQDASGLTCTYGGAFAPLSNPTCAYDAAGALAAGQDAACAATAVTTGTTCPDTGYTNVFSYVDTPIRLLRCVYSCAECLCDYQLSPDFSHSVGLSADSLADFCPPQSPACTATTRRRRVKANLAAVKGKQERRAAAASRPVSALQRFKLGHRFETSKE